MPGGLAGCSPEPAAPNRLETMTVEDDIILAGDQRFKVWVADNTRERERGLMRVTAEQMAPLPGGVERGMWFIFPHDQSASHGFWMRNVPIPLDIAFVRADGTIVTIHTMAPLDERMYRSDAPYRFALEVNANVFSRLGVRPGDRLDIPESLLKSGE
jgi:uncharacterized membrane protein (UPF0127 family)